MTSVSEEKIKKSQRNLKRKKFQISFFCFRKIVISEVRFEEWHYQIQELNFQKLKEERKTNGVSLYSNISISEISHRGRLVVNASRQCTCCPSFCIRMPPKSHYVFTTYHIRNLKLFQRYIVAE